MDKKESKGRRSRMWIGSRMMMISFVTAVPGTVEASSYLIESALTRLNLISLLQITYLSDFN